MVSAIDDFIHAINILNELLFYSHFHIDFDGFMESV